MRIISQGLSTIAAACIAIPALAQTDDVRRTDAARSARTSDNAKLEARVVEEVVVTAQRREERLQDVPISISVLSGDALDRSTFRGVAEALTRVPGVSTQINTTSARLGSSSGTVVMRGVPPAAGVSPTAYYLDTIPFGFVKQTFAPDANGYDLERIEVLRGPQGTLYGLSALNGVVRVLTKDASLDDFEFKARTSLSSTKDGGENYRGDMAVNVPIIDGKLAVRAVVGYQYLDGWIDKPNKKDANDAKIGTYRLKINAQPAERLSVGLFGWLSRADLGAPSIAGLSNAPSPLVNLSPLDEASTTDYDAYGLKVGYDFGGASFTSTTSYIDYRINARFDFSPFTVANLYSVSRTESQVFAQEINLNSSSEGSWRWTVGGIYREADDEQLLSRINPVTGALVAPYFGLNIAAATSESFAVFGELTRLFFDGRLELTGGVRYFEDKVRDSEISRQQCINGMPAGLGSCPGQADQSIVPAPLSVIDNKFDSVSPRVVLTWHPSDESTLYASYSQGYRSGLNQSFATNLLVPGFSPVNPDKLKNYEVGSKFVLSEGRINLESSIFFIDWENVPQSLDISIPGPTPFLVSALVNAGSASGYGVEGGATVQVTDGLSLGANFSWNELEVDDDVLTGTLVLYPKGSRLTYSPEYTISGMVAYDFQFGASGLAGRASAAANYLPETLVVRNPSSATVPGTTFYADSVLMAGASFSIESPQGWAATLYGDNLANEEGLARDQFSPRWNTYVRPRTVGLQFDYHF